MASQTFTEADFIGFGSSTPPRQGPVAGPSRLPAQQNGNLGDPNRPGLKIVVPIQAEGISNVPARAAPAAEAGYAMRKGIKRKVGESSSRASSVTVGGNKKKGKKKAPDSSSGSTKSKKSKKKEKKKKNGQVPNGQGGSRRRPGGPALPTRPDLPYGGGSSSPWVGNVAWDRFSDPKDMLNAEIHAFHRYMCPTKEEYEVRMFVIEQILRVVRKDFPDSRCVPFGSWQTQLYLPTGDIDLVVITRDMSKASKVQMLKKIGRSLRAANISSNILCISQARVPIIKFVTNYGQLNVDISLNQTNGIDAGQLINEYLNLLPGARQLIYVIKTFLSNRLLNEVFTGGLGSFSVICMVISFLQIHPDIRQGKVNPELELGNLLLDFLKLYGRVFDYSTYGISIRRGGFYFPKRNRGWYRPKSPDYLCLEDPLDNLNEIASGSHRIQEIRGAFAAAHDNLQARLGRCREFPNDFIHRQGILTCIVEVRKDVIRQRELLSRLHLAGILQRTLNMIPGTDPTIWMSMRHRTRIQFDGDYLIGSNYNPNGVEFQQVNGAIPNGHHQRFENESDSDSGIEIIKIIPATPKVNDHNEARATPAVVVDTSTSLPNGHGVERPERLAPELPLVDLDPETMVVSDFEEISESRYNAASSKSRDQTGKLPRSSRRRKRDPAAQLADEAVAEKKVKVNHKQDRTNLDPHGEILVDDPPEPIVTVLSGSLVNGDAHLAAASSGPSSFQLPRLLRSPSDGNRETGREGGDEEGRAVGVGADADGGSTSMEMAENEIDSALEQDELDEDE